MLKLRVLFVRPILGQGDRVTVTVVQHLDLPLALYRRRRAPPAPVDHGHGMLSGPFTKKLLERVRRVPAGAVPMLGDNLGLCDLRRTKCAIRHKRVLIFSRAGATLGARNAAYRILGDGLDDSSGRNPPVDH